ncbi:WEB family protein At1g12150-like [Python bivittatus]|uniref:WEB family protein At1g12150-like n=1 Tax=Python bivittatus TaxID=176946 RepID=A0A9F5INA7_PYTBI|nr:WEB family protein At1g12150-like [Python bivittatus]
MERTHRSGAETKPFHTNAIEKPAGSVLMDTKENLRNEIWDLRETAANLDVEKQEIVKEYKSVKEQNRTLEAKIDCFKAMVEDLEKEKEELQQTLQQLEDTVAALESQNQTFKETNKVLRSKIQKVSNHVIVFQDYKATQEQDILRMKQVMEKIVGYFKQLEAKIETAEQRYEDEQNQAAELKRTMDELEQIREVQENEILCLQGQLEQASLFKSETEDGLEAPSLLQEMVQAKLVQDSLAMQKTLFFLLSRGMWVLMVMIVGLEFSNVLVFLFSKDFEPGKQLVMFPDCLGWVSNILPSYYDRKLSGLLPL